MKTKKVFIEYLIPIGLGVIFYFLISRFLFFQVKVPSESMYPTIKVGDHIIVSRVHSQKSLNRGDIVVFYSEERKETMIKRLIGLPGDKISITEDHEVYINDKKIDEPYVVFNGGSIGDFKVPENSYFFMGDNRAASCDSREWINPYIQWKDIQGKAKFILYPFDRFGDFRIGKE